METKKSLHPHRPSEVTNTEASQALRISRAESSDAVVIAPIFDQYRQFYRQTSDLKAAEEFLSSRLKNNESVLFYAHENDEAVGFVQLFPSFSSVAMKRLWILNDLFVIPSKRRTSVARQLLERAKEFAIETRSRGLTLKTAADNLPAQHLYESLSWARDVQFYTYNLRV